MIINIYAANSRAQNTYFGKTDRIEWEIDNWTIVGDFHIPFSVMDRTRQKVSKEIKDLNNTTNQPDLTDIYKTLHPSTAKYVFFSSSHRTFWRINRMPGYPQNKSSKLFKNQIHTRYILWKQYNEIKKSIIERNWGLYRHVEIKHSNQWVKKITKEIRKCLIWVKGKHNIPKLVGYNKIRAQRKMYSCKYL